MIEPAPHSRFSGQSAQIQLRSQLHLGSLSGGKSTSVFVEEVDSEGSVVLRIAGRRVQAATRFPLRKGEWYMVRTGQLAGKTILNLESKVSRLVLASELARSMEMPPGTISEAVVRAFLRTGLPLLPNRLMQAYRRVLAATHKSSRDPREAARLEALAQRKGLSLGDDSWDFIRPAQGESGSEGRPEYHGGGDQHPPGKKQSDAPDADAVRENFRLSADADHPLQLFNHVIGEGDHWVVVPISVPGTQTHASLRIRIPRGYALGVDRTQSAFRDATLAVWTGESRWLFGLQPRNAGLSVVLLSGPVGVDPPELEGLTSRLQEFGIAFGTVPLSDEWDDGFSQTDGVDIMTSVDSSA